MNIVDPNAPIAKPERALKGGEDFEAEPGADEPSQAWKESQAALLKMTIRQSDRSWYYQLPMLQAFHDYQIDAANEYEFDEERKQYYAKQYVRFKVSWRYYSGTKRRSYLFWPKHVQVNWASKVIVREHGDKSTLKVNVESGEAEYAYLGKLLLGEKEYDALALWKSTGTMKPRQRRVQGGSL